MTTYPFFVALPQYDIVKIYNRHGDRVTNIRKLHVVLHTKEGVERETQEQKGHWHQKYFLLPIPLLLFRRCLLVIKHECCQAIKDKYNIK